MDNPESPIPEADGEFAFETDPLALRSNTDYCDLLKYIVKLEAQKMQALKDIEEISHAESKALEDPLGFVDSLKSGNVNFPPRQDVDDLPKIEWSKYNIDTSPSKNNSLDTKLTKEEFDYSIKVRGRIFNNSKPDTFNQLWSCEEQKRLEELLEMYPEEPVELRRYKKISEALGTRTPMQVASRIQKYFAKLAKAGMPIPGRAPKNVARDRSKSMFYKKSTFFPQLHVPVKMEDPYDSEPQSSSCLDTKIESKDVIEMLKAAKEQRMLDEQCPVYQSKTMCVGCQKIGFLGARWTDNAGTDYCTDCIVKLMPTERLIPIRQPL
ncbi:ZZ-type zinc finger-containing protein 3 [Aricia agestis]|uniref:ZZ-type zinc finger-containing protein 3 n=1 Tax=Aricia agestis TaxID=91739 RepID=UPI001C203DEB|nr:ZZ-type zinc finger-containing protein 3 [Aricia agestis]